jgi:hypothetical protein
VNISADQRKLISSIEDSICAVLFGFLGTLSLSFKLIRMPSSIRELLREDNTLPSIPLPLTYLAIASFVFLLSLRFLPTLQAFMLLRVVNSISMAISAQDLSVGACLVAALPTVIGIVILSWIVALLAGPTVPPRATVIACGLASGLELFLLSLALVGWRIATSIPASNPVYEYVLALAMPVLIAFAIFWPVVCITKAFRSIRSHSSILRQIGVVFASIILSFAAPAIGVCTFTLKAGYADLQVSPNTCILTAAELRDDGFGSGKKHLNLTAVLINHGSTPFFIIPAKTTKIVDGTVQGVTGITFFGAGHKSELYWTLPKEQVVTVEPEKPLILTGVMPLEQWSIDYLKANRAGDFRANLSTSIDILTSSGVRSSVSCITSDVEIR